MHVNLSGSIPQYVESSYSAETHLACAKGIVDKPMPMSGELYERVNVEIVRDSVFSSIRENVSSGRVQYRLGKNNAGKTGRARIVPARFIRKAFYL